MSDWRLKLWIESNLPKDKQNFSRDAVEILLSLLWKEALKTGRTDNAAKALEDRYGDL